VPWSPEGAAPRVVIAHDFMETYGGAERVTQEMARAFPDAPVVALLGREEVAWRMGVGERFRSLLPVRDRLLRRYRLATPLFPAFADRARLPEADVVLSSSYAFAHRLRSRDPRAARVCYCHSPLRFAWSMTDGYRAEWARGPLSGRAFDALAAALRRSDRRSAREVDRYLTQSPFTAAQIERFYGRRAEVIGAPVDTELFAPDGRPPGERLLVCGRLIEPYKRVSVVLEAFRALPDRGLVVAGDGPALRALRAAAPPNVEFLGHLGDHDLVEAMRACAAAIFPSRDDFGLIPLEVMACGRPVLAYDGGGARHTVVPGVTGELFAEQSARAVVAAVRDFDPGRYDPARIRAHAEGWSAARFRERVAGAVGAAAADRPTGAARRGRV
jgi:glycosyltransferase involved in cell wall biosynthesis